MRNELRIDRGRKRWEKYYAQRLQMEVGNYKSCPKLVLILSRQTCNSIYWNSNKAHMFRSLLSSQKALWVSVCQIDLELQLVL